MTRHLLEIDDLTSDELAAVLDLAREQRPRPVLAGRGMALVFEKPSNRTRNATEIAVVQLGGHPISIRDDEVGFGTRETPEDIARTLACYHAVIGARVRDHRNLKRMAASLDASGTPVPLINLLSDRAHPCQALADLLTMEEVLGGLRGRTLAWVGDANNVCRSLLLGGALAGMRMRIASPSGFALGEADVERVVALGGSLELVDRPEQAVKGAEVVSTDVWVSMGQESEAAARRRAFEGFTVDDGDVPQNDRFRRRPTREEQHEDEAPGEDGLRDHPSRIRNHGVAVGRVKTPPRHCQASSATPTSSPAST